MVILVSGVGAGGQKIGRRNHVAEEFVLVQRVASERVQFA